MKTLFVNFIVISFSVSLLLGCKPDSNIVTSENQTGLLKSDKTNFNASNLAVYDLSKDELDGLVHMRMEEKIARDVYTVLGNKWNKQVFLNIKISEQSHMDAVKSLLNKYNLPDPLTTDEIGVFPDQEFQTLYDKLILQGNESVYNALLVGVAIEELDIKDLENQLSFVDNPDIRNVYTNLKAASLNHLSAFKNNITKYVDGSTSK